MESCTYVDNFGFGSSTDWARDIGGGELDGGENVAWAYSSES
jgi:hypothetical protein